MSLNLFKTTMIGLPLVMLTACNSNINLQEKQYMNPLISYAMPEESEPHEGTWLQWPHHYQYGVTYRKRLDATWVAMTKELVDSETVHIIAYNNAEKERISELLIVANVPLDNIDFNIYKTDDVWVRDNGPIYVRDKEGKLLLQNWGFNGWGDKGGEFTADYEYCNVVPEEIANTQQIEIVDLSNVMINEGGSVEIDGHGTLMATRSAIINENRNPGMSQEQIEAVFTQYLGVTNFIWLDGVPGLEITDMHIDGFARFANSSTIITMDEDSLLSWELPLDDIDTLYNAKNNKGEAYDFVQLPLTQNNVVTTYNKELGYKGSYVNYYIANSKVLVPNYNDANDSVANEIIQMLYPEREVVGIDVRNLYANGGMIHCVTQQQPEQ